MPHACGRSIPDGRARAARTGAGRRALGRGHGAGRAGRARGSRRRLRGRGRTGSRRPASAQPPARWSRSPTRPASGCRGARPSAMIDGIARTATSDGSGRAASVRVADLDGAVARRGGHEARARVGGSIRPRARPLRGRPGADCVVDVLTFLALHGFNGKAVEEGRSFAKLGEAQFDPSISLADDVEHPMSIGIPFDAEGTPKRRVELVRDGVTDEPDPRPAHRESARSRVDRERRRRRGTVWRAAGEPGPAARLDLARRDDRRGRRADCWSPTSGTPASSTRAPRW